MCCKIAKPKKRHDWKLYVRKWGAVTGTCRNLPFFNKLSNDSLCSNFKSVTHISDHFTQMSLRPFDVWLAIFENLYWQVRMRCAVRIVSALHFMVTNVLISTVRVQKSLNKMAGYNRHFLRSSTFPKISNKKIKMFFFAKKTLFMYFLFFHIIKKFFFFLQKTLPQLKFLKSSKKTTIKVGKTF